MWIVRSPSGAHVVLREVGTLVPQRQFSILGCVVTNLIAPALSTVDLLVGLGKFVKRNGGDSMVDGTDKGGF